MTWDIQIKCLVLRIMSKYKDKIISWIEIIVIYIIHFKNFTRELLPRVLVSLFAANASESCLAGRGTRGRRCLRLGRGSPESWPCHINMNPNFTTFLRISCNICSDLHGVTVSSSIIASCSAVCSADKCTFSVRNVVTSKLKLDGNQVISAFRSRHSSPSQPNQLSPSRAIVAKMSSYEHRTSCLKNYAKLKGTDIFLNEDISPATQIIRN